MCRGSCPTLRAAECAAWRHAGQGTRRREQLGPHRPQAKFMRDKDQVDPEPTEGKARGADGAKHTADVGTVRRNFR